MKIEATVKNSYNVIGDIAGQFKTLQALLAKMPPTATPVSVGDLIDRGPDSQQVVDFFRQPDRLAVLGNHEHLMMDFYASEQYYGDVYGHDWTRNGGRATQASMDDVQVAAAVSWFYSLPLYLTLRTGRKNFLISHTFLHRGQNPIEETVASLTPHEVATRTWNRQAPWKRHGVTQIVGHNSQMGLLYFGDRTAPHGICIDTSAERVLTGIHLPSMEIYQQPYVD